MKNNPKAFVLLFIILAVGFLYSHIEDKNEISKKNKNDLEPVLNDGTDAVKLKVDGNLNVYYFDVGQADAILLENAGHYMLIDAGNNADGEKLVAYFKEMGITRFEVVVATHAHEDHIGGMDDILNNFEVGTFYMPDVVTTTKTFEDVISALENNNITLAVPKIGDMFIFGTAKFQVLYVGDEDDDLNDTSIVVRGLFGETAFLFTGDASGKVEEELLDKNIDSDVLKVGHHGSKYSSTTDFLNKVTPDYAIISAGEGNSYQHPHNVALERIKKSGAKIYRTDVDGTVVASSNGVEISIKTLDVCLNG